MITWLSMRYPVKRERPLRTACRWWWWQSESGGRQSQQLFWRRTNKRWRGKERRDLNEIPCKLLQRGMQFHVLEWNEELRTTRNADRGLIWWKPSVGPALVINCFVVTFQWKRGQRTKLIKVIWYCSDSQPSTVFHSQNETSGERKEVADFSFFCVERRCGKNNATWMAD